MSTDLAPLPVFDSVELRTMLECLSNSLSGTARSNQSVVATHKVILAAHELRGLLDAANEVDCAAVLRAAGWTCIPPVDPKDAIPTPEVGQVWRSPKPKTEPRTVTLVGAHRMCPWAENRCVFFTVPSERDGYCLNPNAWAQWVRKSGARPV